MSDQPWGYQALLQRYQIKIPPTFRRSTIGGSQRIKQESEYGIDQVFPTNFGRDTSDIGHLIFALKYEGVELLALRKILNCIDRTELISAIQSKPTSTYLRRLWFFWEWFHNGQQLPISPCPPCKSVPLMNPQEYFTRDGPYVSRQRIRDNLLGNQIWCPTVRRSKTLEEFEAIDLHQRADQAVKSIPAQLLQRAIRFLYTKETRASYQIEKETPAKRSERFIELLLSSTKTTGKWSDSWNKEQFIEVQRELLDPRYALNDFRDFDNYIGEHRDLSGSTETIHWIGAPKSRVHELMNGLIQAWNFHHLEEIPNPRPGAIMIGDKSYAYRFSCGTPFIDFLMATCLSFGFVYIHPFLDGNGRIHRLLLHHALHRMKVTPGNVVVPISSAILNEPWHYDRILESHSKRVLDFIDYTQDERTREIEVSDEAVDLYRYIDFTPHVEQLCAWFIQSVESDLVQELQLLERIDTARNNIREIVDMPDRQLDLLLRICVHNGRKTNSDGFRLGKRKRAHFSELTDQEVRELEQAIQDAFEEES